MITDYAGGGIGLGPSTSQYSEVDPTAVWPEPEMVNHEVDPTFLAKSAVVDMVADAQAKGWTVKVTHAKGSYPSTGRKPSRARHSLAVRMARGEDRAVAVYVEGPSAKAGWSWDTLYRWTIGGTPTKYANVTGFLAVL